MSRFKGFVSFDLLFSSLPLLLMVSHMLTAAWMASEAGEQALLYTEATGKLVTIADYAVKRGAVESSVQKAGKLGSASYRPNVIDEGKLSLLPLNEMAEWMELETLEIGWDAGEGACIYRLVFFEGEARKLYVCGE